MSKVNKQFFTLLIILLVAGIGFSLYQHFKLGLSWWPNDENMTWKFNAELQIVPDTTDSSLKVNLLVPNLVKADVLDESINAAGFGKIILRSEDKNNRMAVLSKSEVSSKQTVIYDVTVASNAQSVTAMVPDLEKEKKKIKDILEPKKLLTLLTTAKEIAEKSADSATLIAQAINFINDDGNLYFWQEMTNGKPTAKARARSLNYLLTELNLPNFIIHVVPYEYEGKLNLKNLPTWIKVYYGKDWHTYDVSTGQYIDNPNSKAMTWWSGNDNFINVQGGVVKLVSFTAAQQSIPMERYLDLKNNTVKQNIYEFSLLNLPAQTQEIYKIILIVPFGVLIILILRIIIGVPTLGTFMPVLIALAFKDTSLIWGIVLFSLVVILGLSFRAYFEKLQLLVVPRLGMLLCVVVLIMALISVVMHKMELSQGLSITLFPMVILTMSIERLSIVWEERGGTEAIKIAIGSLLAATICYVFIFNAYLEYWFFTFPGLLLVVMAVMLLIGRYRGYRLTELYRFEALAQKINDKQHSEQGKEGKKGKKDKGDQ
ncbi:UUP1 family membrane protein [Cysteiniphilum halobium]|uniref:UUP1 family membrane protein n=1 Tax=Cysteiniphilum halobium TaxID=2219059 RepID=UPI000E64682B|nr:UUP1 family membrane protein [Cysteiniphilum halobium]